MSRQPRILSPPHTSLICHSSYISPPHHTQCFMMLAVFWSEASFPLDMSAGVLLFKTSTTTLLASLSAQRPLFIITFSSKNVFGFFMTLDTVCLVYSASSELLKVQTALFTFVYQTVSSTMSCT